MSDAAPLAFAAMGHARNAARAAEVAEIVALLEASDTYVLEEDMTLPKALRIKRLSSGRDGVRGPSEAFVLEASAATGMSFSGMRERVSQALSIRARHPRIWQLFISGSIQWWMALKVEEATQKLPCSAAMDVDRRASHWLGINSVWTLFEQLPVWVTEADVEGAQRRARIATQERFLHVGRFEDDHVGIFGKVAAADGVLFDQALDQIAATLPEPEVPDELEAHERASFIRGQRRAAAFGIFAQQAVGQESLMSVEMVVHVPAEHSAAASVPAADGQAPLGSAAYVEGWGHLLTSTLPEFLSGSSVTVRPVLDPNLIPDAPGSTPSSRQLCALQVRNPRSVFPFSATKAKHCDIDHTVAYSPSHDAGATSMANLGPLDRRAHRMKTAGHWHLQQPEPGVYHWTSPLGYQYLVNGRGSVCTQVPDVPIAPIPELPPQPPVDEPPPDWARAA